MKYFFILLLTGLINFNTPSTYGATTPGEETSEQSQPTSPPTKQTENTQEQAQSEETTNKQNGETSANPRPETESTRVPATLVPPLTRATDAADVSTVILQPEQLYLEHTRIGQAVIEGNVEEYKEALAELTKVFNTSLSEILKKRTSKEENLLDLMIITEKNREYFTSEMFHLLVFKALSNQGLAATQETQLLLDKAHQSNNELAIRLLSSMEQIFQQHTASYKEAAAQHTADYKEAAAQHTKESIDLRTQIISLAKRQYSKTKIFVNTGLATAGGVLSIWGYKLFTQASPNVTSPLPQITEFLSTVSDKEMAIGVMAVGVGVAAKGAHKCVKTFVRRRQLNKQQKQLNRDTPVSF
jgi:hypothetical protein